MNVLRKISIDTVLLWLAVALCIAGLVWLGGAHAWITALGVGVFVAVQEASQATNPPPSETESDGPPSRAGAPGSSREPTALMHVLENTLIARSTLIGLDDNAGIFGATTVDVPALYDQIERQAAEIERLKREFNRAESAYMSDVREAKCERDKARRDENLRANDVFRGIVAENDRLKSRVAELTESVDLLDEQGRKMKAERDAALLEIERLKESLATACAAGEPPTAEQHVELVDALAQIEALKAKIKRLIKHRDGVLADLVKHWEERKGMPCGHPIGDLVGAPGSVTFCGACKAAKIGGAL